VGLQNRRFGQAWRCPADSDPTPEFLLFARINISSNAYAFT
jgi:hypothetical protein